MSRFIIKAQFAVVAFFCLAVNLSAQDQGQKANEQEKTLDRKTILVELQSIRQRIHRLEQMIKQGDGKSKPVDKVKTAQKLKAIEKDGIRIFHDAPIGNIALRAQIPMANGHHQLADVPIELERLNYLQRGAYQGKTSFEILAAQTVYVAFYGSDWGGGGNPSGNWLPEIVSRQQLKEQGWEEFCTLPVTHSIPEYKNEKPWIVFKRKCNAGEKFKLRNHKYQAPVPIWGNAANKK